MPPSAAFRCSDALERSLRSRGFPFVAGADEAGRGSLFGPVYAAAVILDPERPIPGLRDSKLLPPDRRQALALQIRRHALAWAVASVDAFVIDQINILQASRLAIRRALQQLRPRPSYLLLDALTVDLPWPQLPLIHGDARCSSIAAASILAKVHRDAEMSEWDRVYPHYGLARHKGYPAPEHLDALAAFGPSPHHRFSYRPVRDSCPRSLRLLLALRRQLHFRWPPQEAA